MAAAPMLALLVVLIFAGASFFFALAETALFSLTKWQVRQLAQQVPGRGSVVRQLLGEPDDLLAAMVLGNTFATAAMLSTALWMGLQGWWPLVLTIVVLFFLILFGCEVLPKTLAVRRPEKWALRVARPMLAIERLSKPLRRITNAINQAILSSGLYRNVAASNVMTEADYHELLDMAFQQGTLAQAERDIILQIISLDRRTVREVMRPRTAMAAISDDLSIEEMIAAARAFRHRRLPIYDENPDTIVGVLNTRILLLKPDVDLAEAIELPSFVPETMNLLQLLNSLQRQQRGLAIVLDEYGGTAGIVTVEDILEEMVGRVRRDTQPEGFLMERLGPNRWRVAGTLRLDDFRREYPALGDVPEVETMGGLLLSLLEVVPAPGESATFRGLKLTAQATDDRRIREVLVEAVR